MVRNGWTTASSPREAAEESTSSTYCLKSLVWRIASPFSPSEPQTTGLMSLVSDGPTTTAPAPSPKMNAVLRSV